MALRIGVVELIILSGVFIASIFWVWMLVDCAMHESEKGNQRVIWVLVILFTHLLGALLYAFVRRPKRLEEAEAGR